MPTNHRSAPGPPRHPRWRHRLATLLLLLSGSLTVLSSASSTSLRATAAAGLAAQLMIAVLIIHRSRLLSITGLFALLWTIYFPIRLAIISFGGPSPFYFPAVDAATGPQLQWIWVLTTAGFTAFFLAGNVPALRVSSRPSPSMEKSPVSTSQFIGIGLLGIALTAGLHVLHGSSGLLTNVGGLTLLGIAGTSYLEHAGGLPARRHPASLLLTASAVLIGYASGQKQAALTPVAAWIIGRAGAGGRVRIRYALIAVLLVGLTFGAIQGQRDSKLAGAVSSNPLTALEHGLTSYNLAYGVRAHIGGVHIISNVLGGVLYRLKGADYLISIMSGVPSVVPYQHGQSLWEPAFSVLHGAQSVVTLAPQYRHLSLGRYVDQTFISENPTADTSSQSMTIPGDFYLNFGSGGIIVGMFVFGLLYAGFDRYYSIRSPTGAAILAFAGLPLIDLDANVAYMLVTAGLRIAIAFLVIRLFLRYPSRRRVHSHRVHHEPALAVTATVAAPRRVSSLARLRLQPAASSGLYLTPSPGSESSTFQRRSPLPPRLDPR